MSFLVEEPMLAEPRSLVERVSRAMMNSSYTALRGVVCDCDQGVLILRGRVPSYYLKQMAQCIAQKSNGGNAIIDRIEVRSLGDRQPR